HDAANRLLEDSNFTFTYDANGNLVEQITKATGDRTVYTYNVENQLIRVEKFTVAGGLPPVLIAEYRYDALGRRITKEVTQAGTTTFTRYIYDSDDILLEFDGVNVLQARYTHGPGIDEPLVMLRGGASFSYHVDGLGSIWDLTDSAGVSARTYTYDSFGQLLAQTGTVANPYTYTGRELDPETGLYFYRMRYYDPAIGRFVQEDPLVLLGGLNRYAYVNNSPLNFRDPLGLVADPVTLTLIVVAAEKAAGVVLFVTTAIAAGIGINYFLEEAKDAQDAAASLSESTPATPPPPDDEDGCDISPRLSQKIRRQMAKRGWTEQQIQEAIQNPAKRIPAINKATGNPATRYVHPKTGQSVVVDNATGEVIHVGGPGFRYGPASGDLP
ncbi:MAG: RHS repeat-associated core domain-containing protein, partial [Candidatus Binatia bacterium]